MIRADEVKAKLGEDLARELEQLEQLIDSRIKNARQFPLSIDFGGMRGPTPSPRALDAIADKYREHGWTVEITRGDQRDPGPFVKLTP